METRTPYRTTEQHYTLTSDQASDLGDKVLAILACHRGAQTAITGQTIARMLGHANDRKVRVVIERLIAAGQPVAASVSEPVGYYLIGSLEEAEIYERVLRSRAIKTLKRLKDFHAAAENALGPMVQLPLFVIQKTIEGLQ